MKVVIKITAAIIATMTLSFEVAAAGGFLKAEYVSGMNRICIYDTVSGDVTITVKAIEFCPLSI